MKPITDFRVIATLSVLVLALGLANCTKKESKMEGKQLRLMSKAKIKSLDPHLTNDLYSHTQVTMAYEGLLQYHYLKRPYQLIPALAEEVPTATNGGKTYTFKIKKGVLFQDDPAFKKTEGRGRELVAEDFVYSWKRLADPKTLSTGWWIFDGKIVGLNEWRKKAQLEGQADYSAKIEGLQTLDRYTLQVKLVKPSTQFLYYLAMGFAMAVPNEAVVHYGKDFVHNPVGTGPYKLVREESNLNSKLVWVKNPTFRKEFYPSEGEAADKGKGLLADAGKQLPLTDRIEYHIYVEDQPRWLNFMAGKLDALEEVPKDNFSTAIVPGKGLTDELQGKGVKLHTTTELDLTHITFNMVDPLVGKNKYLRQAMSLAYDQKPVVDLFYYGKAVPAQGPIPPGLNGYDPGFKNPYRQFNLTKAKELLKKAGYPGGKGLPTIDYVTNANSTNRQMSDYFQKSMRAIGIKVKISAHTWPEFMGKVRNKKGQIFAFAWLADYPDAENFLQLFYGKNVSPGPNDANYQNPKFDQLYDQALKLQDTPERTALYQKMRDIVVEDVPYIWGVHRVKYALVNQRLKNFKLHDFDHAKAKYFKVETTKKI